MAWMRLSRTRRNRAEHQDRHRAGCEPPPAILSSGQSLRQRSKIAQGIRDSSRSLSPPLERESGFEASFPPMAIPQTNAPDLQVSPQCPLMALVGGAGLATNTSAIRG